MVAVVGYVAVVTRQPLRKAKQDPEVLFSIAMLRRFARRRDYNEIPIFTDVSSSDRVDFFGRPVFIEAVAKACEEGVPLVIASLQDMLRCLANRHAKKPEQFKAPKGNDIWQRFSGLVLVEDAHTGLPIDKDVLSMMALLTTADAQREKLRRHHVLNSPDLPGKAKKRGNSSPSKLANRVSAHTRGSLARVFARRVSEFVGTIVESKYRGSRPSLGALAKTLNEEGHRTRRGAHWTAENLRRTLRLAEAQED